MSDFWIGFAIGLATLTILVGIAIFILNKAVKDVGTEEDDPVIFYSKPDLFENFEFEMLIEEEGTPFPKGSWVLITRERIKYPENIERHILEGTLRRIEKQNKHFSDQFKDRRDVTTFKHDHMIYLKHEGYYRPRLPYVIKAGENGLIRLQNILQEFYDSPVLIKAVKRPDDSNLGYEFSCQIGDTEYWGELKEIVYR